MLRRGETEKAWYDFTPQVCRGQRDDRRLSETGETRVVWHNPATAGQTERDPLIGAEPCPGLAAASDDWWLGRGTGRGTETVKFECNQRF